MQTIIVSLVALIALAVVARRLFAAIRPARGQAACPACGSGSDTCATTTPEAKPGSDAPPLELLKSKSR